VFRSYRAVGIIEDPGPPLTIRIGGRERPWLTRILGFVLVPLKRLRIYRRQRFIQREIDRVAALLERELPGGMAHPEFQDKLLARVHERLGQRRPAP